MQPMNHRQIRTIIYLCALSLFVASLFLPAVSGGRSCYDAHWDKGYVYLLVGPVGLLLDGQVGWLANLTMVWAFLGNSRVAAVLSVGLVVSTVRTLVFVPTLGTPEPVCDYGLGFYLWLACAVCVLVATLIRSQPGEATGHRPLVRACKTILVFLAYGPPIFALPFYLMGMIAVHNPDLLSHKILEMIQVVSFYIMLAAYPLGIISSLIVALAYLCIPKRLVIAALIGATVHFLATLLVSVLKVRVGADLWPVVVLAAGAGGLSALFCAWLCRVIGLDREAAERF